MVKMVGVFLFLIAAFTFFFGTMFINEKRYRKFLMSYMKFFGIDASKIPSSPAIPDPLKPQIVQAKVAGYMFIIFSIVIFITGMYLFSLK